MHYEPSFDYYQITRFMQWYVAGFGDSKLRAHTALPGYLSAWKDHCDDRKLRFPHPGTRERKRVNRFLQGIQNAYPHVVKRDHPLVLDELAHIASDWGIHDSQGLWTISLPHLCRWARIITAHDACLRAVEHSFGMQVQDHIDHGHYATLVVGRREVERKLKRRVRTAVLHIKRSHLSAGYVLRILRQRVHRGATAADCLFPLITSIIHTGPEPWKAALRRLRGSCTNCGIPGPITGRSLRAGGATDYFAFSTPADWIKQQGGWLSDAYQLYNRPTSQQRARIASIFADEAIHERAPQAARLLL